LIDGLSESEKKKMSTLQARIDNDKHPLDLPASQIALGICNKHFGAVLD